MPGRQWFSRARPRAHGCRISALVSHNSRTPKQSTTQLSELDRVTEPSPISTQRSGASVCLVHLQPTPSTSSWAARFPSVFPIGSERDLPAAIQLIVRSQGAIGPSQRARVVRRPEYVAAEEVPDLEYVEGAARRVLVNAYERNRHARDRCLRHYGRSCVVCGFNFETRYGEVAAGFIHVHHIVPIARLRKQYRLKPITDLRPVCANCHAVLHRREPPFAIEEVEQMLGKDGK